MFILRYGNYTMVTFLSEEAERAAGLLQSESLHMQASRQQQSGRTWNLRDKLHSRVTAGVKAWDQL